MKFEAMQRVGPIRPNGSTEYDAIFSSSRRDGYFIGSRNEYDSSFGAGRLLVLNCIEHGGIDDDVSAIEEGDIGRLAKYMTQTKEGLLVPKNGATIDLAGDDETIFDLEDATEQEVREYRKSLTSVNSAFEVVPKPAKAPSFLK